MISIRQQRNLRLLWTFYRNHFWADMLLSAIGLWTLHNWGLVAFEAVFWFKIISYGIIYYFVNSLRKNEYYYYSNLGFRKSTLWAITLSVDFVLYITLIILTYQFR